MKMQLALVSSVFIFGDAARFKSDTTMDEAYQVFRHVHGGVLRVNGSSHGISYSQRRQIFAERVMAVERQNAREGSSWKAVVNKFADHTDGELSQMLGYVHSAESQVGGQSSFLQVGLEDDALPDAVDWVSKAPKASEYFRDQGGCGSCWAVAAVSALEMHAEIQNGHVPRLSTEQVIDCTPNPRECGGKGGCRGATSELALEYVKRNGVALESEYPIDGVDTPCFDSHHPKAAHIDAWTKVPRNDGAAMLRSLATSGPLLVSVAGSDWFGYASGIFEGCTRDAVLNHAVVVVGYGWDDLLSRDYWKLRNSWGQKWGEKGYLRILRHSPDDAEQYCGVDREPLSGFVCKGGPKEIKVCGMCGVLSHPSHPNTVTLVN